MVGLLEATISAHNYERCRGVHSESDRAHFHTTLAAGVVLCLVVIIVDCSLFSVSLSFSFQPSIVSSG